MTKEAFADGIISCCQVDEENQDQMWNELLHEEGPHPRKPSYRGLQTITEIKHVFEGDGPNDGFPRPLSGALLHLLIEIETGNADKNKVDASKSYESSHQCILFETKPESTGDNDGHEVGRKVGKYCWHAQLVDLFFESVDPSSCKGLEETHKEHDEVNVKVDCVQEDEASISSVNQTKEESNQAAKAGQLGLRDIAKVDSVACSRESSLQKGESTIDTEKEQIKEKESTSSGRPKLEGNRLH